jgi:hypothetical protein
LRNILVFGNSGSEKPNLAGELCAAENLTMLINWIG